MDLTETKDQRAFREEIHSWLAANVPGSLGSSGSTEGFNAHRAWERKLSAAGYSGIGWPKEYGGRGADVVTRSIFEEEYLLADGPERVTQIGLNLLGPTLMVHGSVKQKQRWLPGILDAGTIWSQGFSEPGAGSDLAGIRTRAERDGEDWIVNGQKIWTSFGGFADWIFALVRTDPEASRHQGITFLCLDMKTPGVEARPIVQLDGFAGFAEVFFTDARVPPENVIGEVNDGWAVAMTMLGFERDAPSKPAARYRRAVKELIQIARERGVDTEPVVRDRIARLYAGAEAYRSHTRRALTRTSRGETIGPEASITKLLWSELERDIYETGRDILGPHAEVMDGSDRWHSYYWFARAATIYAGTSEIQRNIVAERVLGLPKG